MTFGLYENLKTGVRFWSYWPPRYYPECKLLRTSKRR
jgi:hypothetical protein